MNLSEKDRSAVNELKSRILRKFPEAEFILFGSKAQGSSEDFSDIDILILLDRIIKTSLEKQIFGDAFKVELAHDIVFGIIVHSKKFWNSPLAKEMPIHWNIDKDGIRL